MNVIKKIIGVTLILILLVSCKSKLDQSTMFSGRANKNKKGVYNTGLNSKTAPSIQIAKEHQKLNKHYKKPKKGARKAQKELDKKKAKMAKKTAKFVKKKKLGVKPGKEKTGGDK